MTDRPRPHRVTVHTTAGDSSVKMTSEPTVTFCDQIGQDQERSRATAIRFVDADDNVLIVSLATFVSWSLFPSI